MTTAKTPRIIVYVDSIEKYGFFLRFHQAMRDCNYELVFITNRLSIKIKSVFDGIDVRLLSIPKTIRHAVNYLETREIIDRSLTIEEANTLFESTLNEAESLKEEFTIKCIFIFGGMNTAEKAMAQFASVHAIKTLFFELANIPGKIFIDHQGTNACSSIYSDKTILNKYSTDTEEYVKWREQYLQDKEYETMPPQSTKKRKIQYWHLVDHIGYPLFKIPFENNQKLYKKILDKIWQKTKYYEYDTYDIGKGGYIFFPMQVSNDAQLLFHSNMKNDQVLKYAYEVAKSKGLDLLVKPHPAEKNRAEFDKIYNLKREIGFYLVNEPSINILKYCAMVITINSTVGLEAIILSKPVEFMGNTIYKHLEGKLLEKYVLFYLVDIDYYAKTDIDKTTLIDILNRIA